MLAIQGQIILTFMTLVQKKKKLDVIEANDEFFSLANLEKWNLVRGFIRC